MAEFFEFDPLTGIKTETEYDDLTDELKIIRTADSEPLINYTTAFRNEAGLNKKDIAEGWWLYAKIPPIEMIRMRAKGINIFEKEDGPLMFREINEHYPYLKCTTGKEGKSAAPTYFLPKVTK